MSAVSDFGAGNNSPDLVAALGSVGIDGGLKSPMSPGGVAELRRIVGDDHVLGPGAIARYRTDAGEARGLRADPDLVVRPGAAAEVAAVMRHCYDRGIPLVPRGGGTGLVGGSLAFGRGLVVDLGRLDGVSELRPEAWRMTVGAGLSTHHVRRLARESGLYFPPDPGAAEESQIGGNVATDAGGPHAFKYGTTGAWVMGLELVVPPGRVISVGGATRKDVASYDLKSLFVGSEGTLGIITECTLRLIPYPPARHVVVAAYRDAEDGCRAVQDVLTSGLIPAAVEYLDHGAIEASGDSFPGTLDPRARFLLLVELDGAPADLAAGIPLLNEALAPCLQAAPCASAAGQNELWRWRDGVTGAVRARLGGKLSADVAVPAERFHEALEVSRRVAAEAGLELCGWGHAGDANLHSTFVFDPGREGALDSAERGADRLLAEIAAMGGSIAAEHGIGWAKRGRMSLQLEEGALGLHRAIKGLLDPAGLLNPGKKS
jgi:glycolate oxidase subunit GlcD